MKRIIHPVQLEGKLVVLEPLAEAHFSQLITIGKESRIWEHLPLNGTDSARLETTLRNGLLQRLNGSQYPFTVLDAVSGNIVGSTRLLDIFPEHNKLEIGWTWYTPSVWGKGHNLECKLLLLRYCFETLGLNRVQLKTREANVRSRAAIAKIGGTYEGTLRKDRVLPDGQVRDTMVFSILDEEWGDVEAQLLQQLAAFNNPSN